MNEIPSSLETPLPQTSDPLHDVPAATVESPALAATMGSLAAGLLSVEAPLEDEVLEEDSARTVGTFYLEDLEVALAAEAVREVVPYPDLVTSVPLTPEAVHGVFSLRGEVLPIVDASLILGQASKRQNADRRVAIIDIGSSYVGVVFDKTGEVLRIDDSEDFEFSTQGGALEGVIERVIQLDEGARCIQQLSLELIGQIPGVPYRQDGKVDLQERVDQATYRKAVSVRVGQYELAFPMENLVEIQEGLKAQPSPEYFPHCRGVVQLRGRSFATMNFRGALELPDAEDSKKLVFIQRNGNTIALEVDTLVETLEFKDTAPIPVPALPDSTLGAICGEILPFEEERHVLLIDVDSLFDHYQVSEGASLLGSGHEEQADQSARLRVEEERAVFTFEVGKHALSLSMENVLEVRSMPKKFVAAGSNSGCIMGLMELRGNVVPLICMQERLGLAGDFSQPDAANTQAEESDLIVEEESVVVIAEHKGQPYGLVVDRVKSMTRFHPSEASSAATAFRGPGRSGDLLNCVDSALLINTPTQGSQTIVILDVGRLVSQAEAPMDSSSLGHKAA